MSISLEEGYGIFVKAREEIHKSFVGNDDLITCIFLCLVSAGLRSTAHMLIIGKTGTGKTELAKLINPMFGFGFHRIDGSGEPLPSDIIGYEDIRTGNIRKGPVFTNLLLVDEINRLSPRTRAALLQPMAERIVTIGDLSFVLDPEFMVIATENPTSYGDADPLRPQERDRFALSFFSDWPSDEEQSEIIDINLRPPSKRVEPEEFCRKEDITALKEEVANSIYIDESMKKYGKRITRNLAPSTSSFLEKEEAGKIRDTTILRGANDLLAVSRGFAFLQGDYFVEPKHIRWVAKFALSHRIDPSTLNFTRHDRMNLIARAIEETDKEMANLSSHGF